MIQYFHNDVSNGEHNQPTTRSFSTPPALALLLTTTLLSLLRPFFLSTLDLLLPPRHLNHLNPPLLHGSRRLLSFPPPVVPPCKPLLSCSIFFGRRGVCNHAAVHGQALGAAEPGGRHGAGAGALCEFYIERANISMIGLNGERARSSHGQGRGRGKSTRADGIVST